MSCPQEWYKDARNEWMGSVCAICIVLPKGIGSHSFFFSSCCPLACNSQNQYSCCCCSSSWLASRDKINGSGRVTWVRRRALNWARTRYSGDCHVSTRKYAEKKEDVQIRAVAGWKSYTREHKLLHTEECVVVGYVVSAWVMAVEYINYRIHPPGKFVVCRLHLLLQFTWEGMYLASGWGWLVLSCVIYVSFPPHLMGDSHLFQRSWSTAIPPFWYKMKKLKTTDTITTLRHKQEEKRWTKTTRREFIFKIIINCTSRYLLEQEGWTFLRQGRKVFSG